MVGSSFNPSRVSPAGTHGAMRHGSSVTSPAAMRALSGPLAGPECPLFFAACVHSPTRAFSVTLLSCAFDGGQKIRREWTVNFTVARCRCYPFCGIFIIGRLPL